MNNTFFFVLFPQASEPHMNFNISKMVYLQYSRNESQPGLQLAKTGCTPDKDMYTFPPEPILTTLNATCCYCCSF